MGEKIKRSQGESLAGRFGKRWWWGLMGLALFAAACGGAASGGTGSSDAVGDVDLGGAPNVVGWNTDWTNSTIDLSELIKGRPESDPRDIIVPIDEPKFETVVDASQWLEAPEPVALLNYTVR